MREAPDIVVAGSNGREKADAASAAVVFLGAGRPARGTQPSALTDVGPKGRVLDWLLEAFRPLDVERVTFVGGYRLADVASRYPDIALYLNTNWESEGPLGSLLTAPIQPGSTLYVSYTDIVYEQDVIGRLAVRRGDVVLLTDRTWRRRFAGRPLVDLARAEKVHLDGDRVTGVGADLPLSESAEFVGVVKLGPPATEWLAQLRESRSKSWAARGLPALLQALVDEGFEVTAEETQGRWAELNAPQDLARFVLGTKAGTLARLQPLVKDSFILDHHLFTVGDWSGTRGEVLDILRERFGKQEVIVRSSTTSEDSWTASNAGAFTSATAAADDRAAMAAAVETVIASYAAGDPAEEILVQPLLKEVSAAGVMMSRSPKTGGPYLVVNYDDASGSTHSVTAGTAEHAKTAYVHLSRTTGHGLGPVVDRLAVAAGELEELVGHDSLDVEFALLPNDVLAVLQVRPIVADYGDWHTSDEEIHAALRQAEQEFERLHDPGPFVVGRSPCLGIMPDWNPAEIVGVKPRPLALSLYQHLITDEVWARQRAELGYRDVRPCPLVVTLAGQPFVDVRASFNSFVPRALDDTVAAKLVDHYLERLRAHPYLHDKVEFEIALTCMTFDFDEQARARVDGILAPSELRALRTALARISRRAVEAIDEHLRAVDALESRAEAILRTVADPVARSYLLLEDCRRIGTLAFSHLARDAFIAMEWLRSLVRTGVLDQPDVESFLGSLKTITHQFTDDAARVAAGEYGWHDFIDRYGHLRPGTYEITSPCYADTLGDDLASADVVDPAATLAAEWSEAARAEIERRLVGMGIPIDFATFESFLRRAITAREYSKFAFTRNLSAALEDFARIGAQMDLTREQLSYLHVDDLLALRSRSATGAAERLSSRARAGEEAYRRTLAVELPALVFSRKELWAFEQFEPVPNFVTTQSVRAPAVGVAATSAGADLDGRIALIPSADPGYDWLFLKGIRGLVTAYGGVNSHMAIRAAELGLPAAIGVGQRRYDRLCAASVVELDCASRSIRVVL
jgi:choline kinase/phosphohistidine swiveling domain-containing protein